MLKKADGASPLATDLGQACMKTWAVGDDGSADKQLIWRWYRWWGCRQKKMSDYEDAGCEKKGSGPARVNIAVQRMGNQNGETISGKDFTLMGSGSISCNHELDLPLVRL